MPMPRRRASFPWRSFPLKLRARARSHERTQLVEEDLELAVAGERNGDHVARLALALGHATLEGGQDALHFRRVRHLRMGDADSEAMANPLQHIGHEDVGNE